MAGESSRVAPTCEQRGGWGGGGVKGVTGPTLTPYPEQGTVFVHKEPCSGKNQALK